MNAKDIHTLNQRYDAIRQYKQKNNKLDWKFYISGKLFPDEAFFNFKNRTLYIIEKKFQNSLGSVDEKLQTCAFKKLEYLRLTQDLCLVKYIKNIEYIYICNEWFKHDKYKDVIDYIENAECQIYFDKIPLNILGLTNG